MLLHFRNHYCIHYITVTNNQNNTERIWLHREVIVRSYIVTVQNLSNCTQYDYHMIQLTCDTVKPSQFNSYCGKHGTYKHPNFLFMTYFLFENVNEADICISTLKQTLSLIFFIKLLCLWPSCVLVLSVTHRTTSSILFL